MRKKLKSLSVFFPVFNEEKNLALLIAHADQVFSQASTKYELIIVNDGSQDRGLKKAQELQKEYPQLKIVSHSKNLGYGEALKTGIQAARYEWIFWSDADLQFDFDEFEKFIEQTDRYQAIIGYRIKRAEGFQRTILVSVLKFGIDLLFRIHVKDIDCAFKLIKADLLKDLDLQSGSAFTTSEILYLLKKKKIRFKEIPVQHYPRRHGKSSGANLKVLIKALLDALKTYSRTKWKTLHQ